MCGITGYIDIHNRISPSVIQQMTDTLMHRGPDGGDTYISENGHYALGHRRLSFLDLSEQGKQPMKDNSEKVIITFNGEIYNFPELKKELSDSYEFKTSTDTEVILAGYRKWGIDVVNHLKGMFAFALLDEEKQQLYFVRDRFGIKPLYYVFQNDQLLFASELKAIHAANIIQKEMDFSSFADYFVYRYIPSPKTIWKHIHKLPPAHYATVDLQTLNCKLVEYWTIPVDNQQQSDQQMIEQVGSILQESVRQHMYADVPVGSFLSGGYDSSTLVAYMDQLGQKPATFSIGFSKWEKSEDHFAKIVANHLNVPNESVVADETSLRLVDRMAVVYDEPIADISIVPTYMVSQLARSRVKAVLSGEGADELFGGYTWQHDFFNQQYPSSVLDKLKRKLFKNDPVNYYANAMAMGWFDREELKKMLHPDLHQYIPEDVHWFYRKHFKKEVSPLKSIQYMDVKCFMGELVLTKIDRASMANSLEVRVPFLDHELFEYVFKLDEKTYFRKDQTKYLLYKNIEQQLPKEILERKKQGFVGPDAYYMDLNWYKDQLKNSRLVELKLIKQSYIDDLYKESYNWKLWKLLIMEKWVQQWV
ncbi:asparagine synthase (glutamine-hydrolyzing) [Crocinitomicaceae bacterium CZZ-1]|uniref:asparagine synthase (glutamine-hydrolyzing) n=1 Tax=Taishania pollutisoli TaxID=2766479 RepID=A0A8J6TSD4_9FLAO|nr:asparagine synthase (glutamine-hydrolyzing) [Taishania pollutisoli]MBC9811124.1 asparagine synthase (glutamine-hydrolyzing) [Taishania pollutisoli]